MNQMKIDNKLDCIPVGCVPPAHERLIKLIFKETEHKPSLKLMTVMLNFILQIKIKFQISKLWFL